MFLDTFYIIMQSYFIELPESFARGIPPKNVATALLLDNLYICMYLYYIIYTRRHKVVYNATVYILSLHYNTNQNVSKCHKNVVIKSDKLLQCILNSIQLNSTTAHFVSGVSNQLSNIFMFSSKALTDQ